MRRLLFACVTIFCAVFLFSQTAFSWGWAVHTYIDKQFQTKWQIRNTNLLYGSLVPDIFNYQFDAPALYMHDQTHNNFMKLWDAARSQPGMALAFGFVSHNELWGVDFTAHQSGITVGQHGTIPENPEAGGYVVAKSYKLKAILDQIPEFAALNLPEPVALQVCHELVEYGVDILMTHVDPTIGARITAAALPPNPNFPMLLEKAYAKEFAAYFGLSDVEAHKYFMASERQFRQFMILYGQVLNIQDDATKIALIAEYLAAIATAFLAANGISLPPGVDIEQLAGLLQFGIGQSITMCSSDFLVNVTDTASFVEQQLAAHEIGIQ